MSGALYPRLLPAGDTAIIVELGDAIDAAVSERVLALDRLVAAAQIPGVIETLPTNRSLFVLYEPLIVGHAALAEALTQILAELPEHPAPMRGRSWTIPVIYGGDYGIDLAAVASRSGLAEDEVIRRHTAPEYRVFMIGFQPGFAYLGEIDPVLRLSRHETPRVKIPAGTVSIAGIQTVVNSVEAPSGWNLIGRTPVRVFDLRRDEPFLLAPGDRVRFRALPHDAWVPLAARSEAGELVAEPGS